MKNLEAQSPEKFNGVEVTYNEDASRRKSIEINDLVDGKLVTKHISISAGTVTVNPTSKRGLYHRLKKNLEQTKNESKGE